MIAGTGQRTAGMRNALRMNASEPGDGTDQNAIALDITGRDYVSYSAISTYQRCPLRYYSQASSPSSCRPA